MRQHHSAAVRDSCTALLQGMARLRGRRGSGDSSMRSTRRQGARQAAGCSTHHPLGSWRNAHCEGRPGQSPGPAQVQQRQHRLALHATTPACRLTWTGLAVISCATELREQQQGWEGSICRLRLGSRGALVGWRECCAALPPRSRPAHLLRRGKVSCRPSTGPQAAHRVGGSHCCESASCRCLQQCPWGLRKGWDEGGAAQAHGRHQHHTDLYCNALCGARTCVGKAHFHPRLRSRLQQALGAVGRCGGGSGASAGHGSRSSSARHQRL